LLFVGCIPALPGFEVESFGREKSAYAAAGILTLLVGLWASWATWARSEWVVAYGKLTFRRRFASWWRTEQSFEPARLEIEHTYDSDGDDRFTLRVLGADRKRKIATALYDGAELLHLAEWLSARTHFPVERP